MFRVRNVIAFYLNKRLELKWIEITSFPIFTAEKETEVCLQCHTNNSTCDLSDTVNQIEELFEEQSYDNKKIYS